mmetsp:Transcript_42751/g.71094  ORF Transcript_42751/g.71094 Transcript_42751/m.71094 type:complete len:84 (+) Transcript_42751:1681-1932(+)
MLNSIAFSLNSTGEEFNSLKSQVHFISIHDFESVAIVRSEANWFQKAIQKAKSLKRNWTHKRLPLKWSLFFGTPPTVLMSRES